LEYLFSTTESIRHDQRVGVGLPNGRQQHALANGLRDVERLFVKPECSGHAATAGVERLEIGTHLPEQRLLVAHLHQRFLMTMSMEEHGARQSRWLIVSSMTFQKFAEQKRLGPQPRGLRIGGKEIA